MTWMKTYQSTETFEHEEGGSQYVRAMQQKGENPTSTA